MNPMKLEPALQHALAVWRTELGYAAEGNHPSLSESEAAGQRVTVIVRYSGDIEALRQAGLATGFDRGWMVSGSIALADLEQLDAVPGVESVALVPEVTPSLDNTVKEMRVPWKVPPTAPWPGKGAGVIVAVIDSGIDIFHESFRDEDADKKTRILELWDQTPTATGGSPPPAGFAQIGRLYKAADINAALAAGPPFVSVDSDGHGTHVMGIAAGDGSQDDRCSDPGTYVGVAPEADLVVVKAIGVPGANLPDAFEWCAQASIRHQTGNPPVKRAVVVNCSFSHATGPHDGTDPLDEAVDVILRPPGGSPPPGIAFVMSAGNTADDDIHETATVPPAGPNGSVTVPFFVPEGSKKVDVLDIWYSSAASLNLEVIAPADPAHPGPSTTGVIAPIPAPPPPANGSRAFLIGPMTLTVTSLTVQHANNRKQILVQISVPANAAVRNGVWQLRLTNTTATPAVWDAWFATEHGDSFPTFALPTEHDPVARRRVNTIGSPGTSRNVITVANYDDRNGALADSSSRGSPTQAVVPPGEIKPTIAAPGVSVAAPRSRDDSHSNSSCCDQLVVDKSGTSMAVPHVTGLVALMFEKNRTLTFVEVRAHLQLSGRTDGIPAAEVPPVIEAATGIRGNHIWGSGKVDAAVALAGIPVVAAVAASGGASTRPLAFAPDDIGLTPHTFRSRLADLQRRFGPRPGLQLFAALVSEHVDEALRLVNENRRVLVVWRRLGGPQLVRRLLHGPAPNDTLLPRTIDGLDVAELLAGFLAVLDRFAGPRLRADLARFADFVRLWPGASLDTLDQAALAYGGSQ
jgi:subtilisin family serine protease